MLSPHIQLKDVSKVVRFFYRIKLNIYLILLRKLKYYNDISGTYEYILPGIIVQNLDDEWFKKNQSLIEKSKEILYDKPRIMTIALSKNSLMFNNEIAEKILEQTEEWNVDGYYIVSEHPENKYLVDMLCG